MRISALPTCWANVLTAFWLCGETDQFAWLAFLLCVSSCFYLGGMVLNDVYDAKIDAVERPERPIPSGKISVSVANIIGYSLLSFGLLQVCGYIGGYVTLIEKPISFSVGDYACLLFFAIWGYNFGLKRIPIIGPITMGLCRLFNILMVSFAVGGGMSVYAVSVFSYITALTILSRYEAKSLFARKLVGVGLASIILIDSVWCLVCVGVFPALVVLTLYPVAIGLRRIVSMT